jgi:hypothetical protein
MPRVRYSAAPSLGPNFDFNFFLRATSVSSASRRQVRSPSVSRFRILSRFRSNFSGIRHASVRLLKNRSFGSAGTSIFARRHGAVV